MFPDTLHLGPIPLHLFGIFLALAFLAAGQVATRGFVQLGYDDDLGGRVLTWAVLGSLAGAKLWIVLADFPAFLADPVGFVLSGSGWVFYGGLLGGTAGVSWVFHRAGVPWFRGADVCAPAIALGQAIGRVGCQVSGDGDWGIPTTVPWGMRYPYAVAGWPYTDPTIHVHPTPVYETLAYLAVFAFLWRRRRTAFAPGTQLGWYLVLASGARFAVEFLRINDVIAFGLTAAQLTSVVLVAAGVALLGRRTGWRAAAA